MTPDTAVTEVGVALVPLATKSEVPTPETTESKSTRNTSVSALVVAAVGLDQLIDVRRGAVVSTVTVKSREKLLLFVLPLTVTDAIALTV